MSDVNEPTEVERIFYEADNFGAYVRQDGDEIVLDGPFSAKKLVKGFRNTTLSQLLQDLEGMKHTKDTKWVAHYEYVDGWNKAISDVQNLIKEKLEVSDKEETK